MPEHKIFIELFAGSMAITRRKRPAPLWNIGVEINQDTARALSLDPPTTTNFDFMMTSALTFLHYQSFETMVKKHGTDILVYADPPYLMETRKSEKPIYSHEFGDPAQHIELAESLRALKCNVIVSGYRSALYEKLFAGWRSLDIPTTTRGGPAIETIWLNFPEPLRLHDYSYLGDDFTDRQRIKRKRARWLKRLEIMPTLERQLLFEAIKNLESKYYGKEEI